MSEISILAGIAHRVVDRLRRSLRRDIATSGPVESSGDLLVVNGEVFQPEYAVSAGLELGDEFKTFFCGIEDIAFSAENGRTRVYETLASIFLDGPPTESVDRFAFGG